MRNGMPRTTLFNCPIMCGKRSSDLANFHECNHKTWKHISAYYCSLGLPLLGFLDSWCQNPPPHSAFSDGQFNPLWLSFTNKICEMEELCQLWNTPLRRPGYRMRGRETKKMLEKANIATITQLLGSRLGTLGDPVHVDHLFLPFQSKKALIFSLASFTALHFSRFGACRKLGRFIDACNGRANGVWTYFETFPRKFTRGSTHIWRTLDFEKCWSLPPSMSTKYVVFFKFEQLLTPSLPLSVGHRWKPIYKVVLVVHLASTWREGETSRVL